MRGYIELQSAECIQIMGGKDSSVARTIELIGYFIGTIVRGLWSLWNMNSSKKYATVGRF